jgi:arsenate reductase
VKATIWHNPRCSKSRETLARLQDAGVDVTVRAYLDDPPTADDLAAMATRLGLRPRDFLRTKEDAWRALEVDPEDDRAVLAAMATDPRLIERPIVQVGERAVLGWPPDAVDALLS